MKHYARDTDQSYQNDGSDKDAGIYDAAEYSNSSEVEILLNACDKKIKPIKVRGTVLDKEDMPNLSMERPPSAPVYDGYATIRARGLYRSRSIRASMELEENRDSGLQCRPPVERKRTLSLMSNLSQGSSLTGTGTASNVQSLNSSKQSSQNCRSSLLSNQSDEIYSDRSRGKHVKPPKVSEYEPLYATVSQDTSTTAFRPISNGSSSSGDGAKVIDLRGSRAMGLEHLEHLKKTSGFSLDSLQSSATPRTPDYITGEEENIFLYTAPESPMRPTYFGVRNSFEDYSSGQRTCFEIEDCTHPASPGKKILKERSTPIRSSSSVSAHYQRTQSFGGSVRPDRQKLRYYERSESESPPIFPRQSNSPTAPPPAPIRRESLYLSKISNLLSQDHQQLLNDESRQRFNGSSRVSLSPTKDANSNFTQQAVNTSPHQSSSPRLFERSYTSQSLATIDQDEILVVPKAMPELRSPIDRRYHTLGHLRVRSSGSSLYHPHEVTKLGSMLNLMPGNYYSNEPFNQRYRSHFDSLPKSTENIQTTHSSSCVVTEYSDPLDFKIGCQTTLRSKPIIPWYELATRDFKRKSCPLVSGSGQALSSNTMNTSTTGGTVKQAHVVAAFEQSLSNMTSRLQQLTATAERKDDELTDMRQTIELLRKQSIQAGLTTAHMQSMGVQTQAQNDLLKNNKAQQPPAPNQQAQSIRTTSQQHNGTTTTSASIGSSSTMQRHHSTDSMCSVNSASSACSGQDKKQKKKGWLRSSFTKAFSRNAKISKTSRHSGHHHPQMLQQSQATHSHVRGSKQILEKSGTDSNSHGGHAEPTMGLAALATQPSPSAGNSNSAMLNGSPSKGTAKTVTLIENAKPIDAIDNDGQYMVEELKKQLREKDLVLTDIRLEALSSASQLESLKETVNKMRMEMMTLKQNNERLQKLVTSRSLAGSETSLGNAISPSGSIGDSRRYSLADGNSRPPMELPGRLEEEVEEENVPPAPAPEPPPLSPTHTHVDLAPPPPALDTVPSPTHISSAAEEIPDITDGKKIAIACYLGQPESFPKYFEEILEADDMYAKNASGSSAGNEASENSDRPKSFCAPSPNEYVIAYTYISGKTTWQNLDYIVRKTFKDYLSTIDPGTNLGLNTDSITSYHLGEAKRGPEMGFPELLPCGYIVGNVRTLYICLQGVGSLAFDSLIPRSIVHRYISLMSEHRRLILCGPSGTGKSYLARRLAEFLVARSGRGNPSEAIATFNVDHKSSKELRQYLGHIAEQASIANGASELPSVIILDNLHHASALGDVFSCLLSSGPAAKLPCIIGTMSQATCNTTNLQLHHNFRWVLTANHMEPVKGFLGRFLRRRLFQLELQLQQPQPELAAVLAWLPLVWQHINRFLETHSSSDVTIGPRLFLSCPLDLKDSQVWFTDIWNYHLSPYLVEAVREGVQLYGRRGGVWNDPSAFIRNSYPWPYGPDSVPPLRQINAEDVGLEGMTANSNENTDPLLNMLMRLQEAANYSENQDEESECASLDSNITPDSSAGAE